MKIKVDRDECLIYFVADNLRLASRWMVELSAEELANFRECENKFWAWQTKISGKLYSADGIKEVAKEVARK